MQGHGRFRSTSPCAPRVPPCPAWQAFGIQARADALEKIGLENPLRPPKDELGPPARPAKKARPAHRPSGEPLVACACAGNIFMFFAGECLSARRANCCLSVAAEYIGRLRSPAEPVGVVGHHQPLELSYRRFRRGRSHLPRLRQLRGHQARKIWCRAVPGRWQTSSRVPACRPARSTS